MNTHTFQESSAAIIKSLAAKSTEAFYKKLQEAQPSNQPDTNTKATLAEHTTAAIITGITEDKTYDETVSLLAGTLAAKSTPALSKEDATAIADTLLQSVVNDLSEIVTNPDDTTLGVDKDAVRDVVVGWRRSTKTGSSVVLYGLLDAGVFWTSGLARPDRPDGSRFGIDSGIIQGSR